MELLVLLAICWVLYLMLFKKTTTNTKMKNNSTRKSHESINSNSQIISLDSSHVYGSSDANDINDGLATFNISYGFEEEKSKNTAHGVWLKPGEIISLHGIQISGGNFYFGGKLDAIEGYGTEASLVDDSLPIETEELNFEDESLGYWPKFISLSPESRGAYLDWLSSDRNASDVPMGYVFMYFYGIERRILVDSINGEVESGEFISLFTEVKRLKKTYGSSYSVSNYMQKFLELMCLLQPDLVSIENVKYGHNSESILFKHRLASIVNAGEPIPKDLALAWVKCNQFYNLRTAARRCETEFDHLFEARYTKKYKYGIVVKPNKTRLRIDYSPASSTLRGFNLTQEDLPDPSVLKTPLKKLIVISDFCTEELDAYSRYIGKKEASREDVAALLLLPDNVTSPENLKVIKKFTEWANQEIENNKGLVSVSDFWKHMGTPLPNKLNKKELELIANLANKAGYGIAPDNRYHHEKPKIGGDLVIFNGGHGHFFAPSATFNEVGMALKLGAMVAVTDSHVDDSELAVLEKLIAHDIKLSPVEKKSLHGYLTWQLNTSASMTGLKIRLEQLDNDAKKVVGHIILSVALADGKIDPNEIKLLEKIYTVLGLDKSKVSSDIHTLSTTKQTTTIQQGKSFKTQEASSGFKLDDDILALHESETKEVQNMLSSIFVDEEIDDQTTSNTANIQKDSTGLDTCHQSLFDTLLTKEKWLREEVDDLCKKFGLMLDGAIETINDWSFDMVDAPVIEENGDVYIDQEIVEELKGSL